MRISSDYNAVPYKVIGVDGKIHYAFTDCDECICGEKIATRDKDFVNSIVKSERRGKWCPKECINYDTV